MKTEGKKSFFKTVPSAVLALATMVGAFIVLFGIGEGLGQFINIKGDFGEAIPYIIYDVIIAICCFYIVRQNPRSIWYVPLICNALLVFAAFVEPNFWITSMWIPVCGGWVLSIIASLLGARIGKRNAISDNSQSPNNLSEG